MKNGPDKGLKMNGTLDGGYAIGYDVGLSYSYTEYYYLGNINDFRIQDMMGLRGAISIGESVGVELGGGAVLAAPRPGAFIIGFSYHIGFSKPGISGNINFGLSKEEF
jgi:hypothetical protein